MPETGGNYITLTSVGSFLEIRLTSATEEANASFAFKKINEDGIGIKWVALYKGEYTAETLPQYHPKGYGAELAECQRYFLRLNSDTRISFAGFCTSSGERASMPVGTANMRIVPTVTMSSDLLIIVRTISGYSSVAGSSGAKPTSIIAAYKGFMLCLYADYGKTIATNNTPVVSTIASGYIEISADL